MRTCLFLASLVLVRALFAGAHHEACFVHVKLPQIGDVRAQIVETKDNGNVVVSYGFDKNKQVQVEVKESDLSRSAELSRIKKETLVHFEVEPNKHAVGAVLDTFENGRVFLFRGKTGNSSFSYKESLWKKADELSPSTTCIASICTGQRVVALKEKTCKEGTATHIFENGWVRVLCAGLIPLSKWRKIDQLTIVPR